MKFFDILIESRVDTFLTKFSNKFNEKQLEKIVQNVPQKFLDWVGKHLDAIRFEDGLQEVAKYLREFEKISSNLPKTDINTYKSIQELWDALSEYANRPRREYQKVEGGNVVYDDGKVFVVNPQTHSANCYYGRGTKWCTVADSDFQFNKFNEDGKLFYILDKKKSADDPFYKIALLKKFDGTENFWDATDKSLKFVGSVLGDKIFIPMMKSINQYINQEYAEQVKIFSDKVEAEKEMKRMEQLRLAKVLRERREEIDERRMDGEWTLGPDCPEEGLKAHALLIWLEDNGDVEVKTNEDLIEIERIKAEIERLNNEYDNSENVETDILDEISDLENELEVLENKIDVYNIFPTGAHYDLTEFEVIDGDLNDRRYAVGTELEMKDSCYDYVEQLIDDIGYEGFNGSFARSHIDTDKVKDTAQDFYEDDVYQNPEVYLDESERELSDEQEREIEILEKKISSAQDSIERLKEYLIDDESIQEQIDELEDAISEFESEIEDIKDSPEGDFPENLVQEKVEELVDDATSDIESFLSNFGLSWEDYIDKDDFIEAVIDSDGYGHTLNGYDGNADEIVVQDETFWVMRID